MRLFLFLCFSFLALSQSYAQFGTAIKYDRNSYGEWNDFIEDGKIHASDITIGLNYWRSLKNKRIDFLPEFTYTLKNNYIDPTQTPSGDLYSMDLQRIGFIFNTHVYPMDFEGDCNCPTFSKQNDFLKKGLFFILSPGVEYFIQDLTFMGVEQESTSSFAFKIGAGIGLDIGLSNLLTISPFAMINYYPKMIGSDQFTNVQSLLCPSCDFLAVENTSNLQPQFGIRLTFRPDYKY